VKIAKKLKGENNFFEADVRRLNQLIQNEARITSARTLEIVYSLLENMKVGMEGEQTQSAFQPLFFGCLSV
jgi:hypothetical protein